MIKRLLHISFWSLLLFVIYLLILGRSIVFDDRFAHVLIAEGEIIDAQVSVDEQWRIQCEGDLPEKLATTIQMFEDQYFPYHIGVNPVSILKAIRDNHRAGHTVRGGSTITMQLARILEGNQPRTYQQKMKEMMIALALELRYSKDEILKAYGQYAPFGGNTVGYCAAALRYYDKHPESLTWTESATLAVLPNAPGKIYPGRSQDILVGKRNFLLSKMLDQGLIDSVTYRLSMMEDLPTQSHLFSALSPHLLQRMKKEDKHQFNHQTTLDASLQGHVVRILQQYQDDYSQSSDIKNIAAVILRSDGSVASYVGNVTCHNDCAADVDILTSQRSPGSTLKPFLYGLAIDRGLITPTALLEDIPVFFNGYSPSNYDKSYRGIIPASEALTTSLNIPAVNLLQQYGTHPFLSDLRQIGFSSMTNGADHYGLTMILGGNEVIPLELATAYSNLYRSSRQLRPVTAYANTNSSKNTAQEYPISAGGSFLTIDMLKGVNRPESEDGWQYLDNHQDIAWKTGTSYGLRDAWSVGCTQDYTVLVWVGNADGEGKSGLTGVDKAAPILFDIFKLLPDSGQDLVPHNSMETKAICAVSGYAATDACTEVNHTSLPKESRHLTQCKYHQTLSLDESGQFQVYRDCVEKVVTSSVFTLEPIVNNYYQKATGISYATPPYLPDCQATSESITIISPKPDADILIPRNIDNRKELLISRAIVSPEVDSLYWFVDDRLINVTSERHELALDFSVGPHRLTVVSNHGTESIRRFRIVE
jgi:penicillin-binding protein 1C